MEQNLKTSFIPKKPIVKERQKARKSASFFTVVAIFFFITMVVSFAGVYFYEQILVKDIANMEQNLNLAKNRFEPAKISQLQELDKRLKASKEVLSGHMVMSPVFELLGDITMKSIRYTKFSYDADDGVSSKIAIKLSGQATGYRAIALQSDLFTESEYFIDPAFSNLALDSKGNVTFDLGFYVDPSFVDYAGFLERKAEASFPQVEVITPDAEIEEFENNPIFNNLLEDEPVIDN